MENLQEEKTISFFRFEDLRIYAKATDYSAWLVANLGTPTNEKQKNLIDSFCRSSYDIALNIAEGSSRNKSLFEHCLKISKTAIRECIVFTTISKSLGLLDDECYERSREYLMELTRMIGALIISLQRGGRRRDENESDTESVSEEPDALDSIDTNF